MSASNHGIHLSTVNTNIYSNDSIQNNIRNLTDPLAYLKEFRRQSRIKKLVSLQESFANMPQSTSKVDDENLVEVSNILNNLKTIRAVLLALNSSDIERATQLGRDIMSITVSLLLRVVQQIGQTNVQTPTLESIIAYIRSLIHTRSAHMRQTIPGSLLISWYELSQLMSAMQNEPELRITVKKAKQLLEIAHETAVWAYKHLSTDNSNLASIGFIDRSSIPYTNE